MSRLERTGQSILLITALIALVGMTLDFVACGTPSQPPSLVGNWTGIVTDSSGHSGTASLSVTEDRQSGVDGTFSYAADGCSVDAQPLLGKAAGPQVSLSQAPSDPVATSLQLTADAAEQHFTGSYSNANGFCRSSGTVTLTKPE